MLVLLGVLIGSMTGVIAVSQGIADPQPLGELIIDAHFRDDVGWELWPAIASSEARRGAYTITLPLARARVYAIAPYLVRAPSTLEIDARPISGAPEARYGLWWGSGPDAPHKVVAVNSHAYFAVLQFNGAEWQPIHPWEMFPWLLDQGEPNRLRVDLSDGWALVRLNEEVATTFASEDRMPFHVGFFIETTPTGGSTIAFERLRIWQAVELTPP